MRQRDWDDVRPDVSAPAPEAAPERARLRQRPDAGGRPGGGPPGGGPPGRARYGQGQYGRDQYDRGDDDGYAGREPRRARR